MRGLLVAPDAGLTNASAEAAAIINTPGLHVKPLLGRVAWDDLLRETVQARVQYDFVWFVTHGDKTGVLLSDGVLGWSSLLPMVQAVRATLIVLNTCDSESTAAALAEHSGADVIAAIVSVADAKAYRMGAQLAAWLVREPTYYAAYNRAKPRDEESYRFFTGQRSLGGLVTDDYRPAQRNTAPDRDESRQDMQILENAKQITELRIRVANLFIVLMFIIALGAVLLVLWFFLARGGGL